MLMRKRGLYLLAGIAVFMAALGSAQNHSSANGIFQSSSDIGETHKGATIYHAATGKYRLTGGGADMWGAADDFHLSWVRLAGDVTLTADVAFEGGSAPPLKKSVLIVRQSLEPGSPYADIAIHGDGHITLQYRLVQNGKTADTVSTEHGSKRLTIERKGNQFTVSAGSSDESLKALPPLNLVLDDPVYVGIGVCAHNANGVETVTFSNVHLERSSAASARVHEPPHE